MSLDDWNAWKTSFAENFSINNWQSACNAITHRYQGGPESLTEYAQRELRLCINEDPQMTENTLIILIVTGLPSQIRSRIDRPGVKTVSDLMKKLGGLYVEKQNEKSQERNRNFNKFQENKEKKPEKSERTEEECSVCALLGRHRRKHPAEKCFNRDKVKSMTKQANLLQLDRSDDEQSSPSNANFRQTDLSE